MTQEIRWHYRFENFSRALDSLKTPLESGAPLNDLELSGIIVRFQRTYELAWKVFRDRMKEEGVIPPQQTALHIIKEAFALKWIDDETTWADMIKSRNEMAHEYDIQKAEKIVDDIKCRYVSEFKKLHQTFGALMDKC